MADTNIKQQIVDKIKDSSSILVTVNSNPTVDELSAALGITLLLNKLNKHATAVFSGAIPPAISFLDPEKTFENTVDSLRDFIIALDKEKADHLRYKVDGDMVKIFITPYRTTISKDDLDFSQGDYNVEFVLAIGVKTEDGLDQALTSHGRILHDAIVASISIGANDIGLGSLKWADTKASSYCEMLAQLSDLLKTDKAIVDEQIATAFLTGIVAATERFSNSKTSAQVMTIAAQLMAAGANQQLIATKLQESNTIDANDNTTTVSLKEGESTTLEKASTNNQTKSKNDTQPKDDTIGALSISHELEGNVDEVASQVNADKQAEATRQAEEELAKQTETVALANQQEAAETAEEQLADRLADVLPQTVSPSVNSLQDDIANDAAAVTSSVATPPPLRGAVNGDAWKTAMHDESVEPSLGGTLNATTEQAADDKQREIDDDRNRTILSHDGGHYIDGEVAAFQAPINAAAQTQDEPGVKDIFGGGSVSTSHATTIQPPIPGASFQTLADIDRQNREEHSTALDAVHAAFDGSAQAITNTPSPIGLPPLPPMPDFSTLPPLPDMPGMMASTGLPQPATLGDITANAEQSVAPTAQPIDPAQFRIPGQ